LPGRVEGKCLIEESRFSDGFRLLGESGTRILIRIHIFDDQKFQNLTTTKIQIKEKFYLFIQAKGEASNPT
jgi:hypothetical protein